jgi:hypothetical protein
MGMAPLATATAFPLDITYKSIKYAFEVTRTAPDTFAFSAGAGGTWRAKLRAQPDGSLLATFGGATRKIVGREEPLGLRVAIDSGTVYLPNVFDPSELRTDVTGKVVRFLQENGGRVEKGQPFVEVEAMKMIMPLKVTRARARRASRRAWRVPTYRLKFVSLPPRLLHLSWCVAGHGVGLDQPRHVRGVHHRGGRLARLADPQGPGHGEED